MDPLLCVGLAALAGLLGLGVATPREMARLMELIATGQVVSRDASEEMIKIMQEQAFRVMIPRSLPETAAMLNHLCASTRSTSIPSAPLE